jgi:hypothetical protein
MKLWPGHFAVALALLACRGGGEEKPQSAPTPLRDASAPEKNSDPRPIRDFVHKGEEADALKELGALRPWEMVLRRDEFLGRRQSVGIVYGMLLKGPSGLILVDEGEGQGALFARVEIPDEIAVNPPLRVVMNGAWSVVGDGWVFQAESVERLLDPTERLAFPPGLQVSRRPPPEDLVSVSALPKKGGAVAFVVLEAPARLGDGWLVGGESGRPIARLYLPGEREPYGDQTRLLPSERWKLKLKRRYWVEVGRPARYPQQLPRIRAKTPPAECDTERGCEIIASKSAAKESEKPEPKSLGDAEGAESSDAGLAREKDAS